MQSMATLAIVIPTKNEEHYLPDVLAALKRQTRQPDELVVADAGSRDKTVAIAKSYGATVVKGGLPGRGRNLGAAATHAEIILFLDADVVITDDRFVEKAVREFLDRRLDVACADVRIDGGTMFDAFAAGVYNWYVRMLTPVRPHGTGFFMLVRRQVFDGIHGFDEEVLFAEDTDFAVRAHKAGFHHGVLNSVVMGVTTRRQERDGRLRMTLVNALAEPYMMLFGPIKRDIFSYGFGHTKIRKPVR